MVSMGESSDEVAAIHSVRASSRVFILRYTFLAGFDAMQVLLG
jgi:hypothetical protein